MRKQNIRIYKDTVRNVKVMVIISSIDNSWETNYRQGLEKENKLIQKKWTNKIKNEEEYTKNAKTNDYITQRHQDYEKILLIILDRRL
jgi:hypothetical protein